MHAQVKTMKTNSINNKPGKGAVLFPELVPCLPADGGTGGWKRATGYLIRSLLRQAGHACLTLSRTLPLAETTGLAVLIMILLGAV